MRRIALVFFMLPLLAPAWTDQDENRWRALNDELRCLVCQNQSIAESAAPLAEDLRAQTRQMIEAGKSDKDIRQYMTARYGDFVLYRPPFKPTTWLLWLGPLLMLLVGAAMVLRMRRTAALMQSAAEGEREQTHADVERLLKDIDND